MKTILITGASSGIGAATALLYAQNGFTVFAGGRNQQRLNELSVQHENITTFSCDLTNKENIKNITIAFPPLDILLLNAGGCEYIDDAVNFDGDLFARVITDNLISIGYCLDVWLKLIKPNGQLAITSSCASFLPLPRAEAYGASKAALNYLAKTLAIDLTPQKINVSVINPGFVETQLTNKNTFSMPCIITSDSAAQYIFKGLSRKKTEINFPKRFTYSLKLLALLPFFIWKSLANKMVKGQ
ncbi:SDR family NAD(P)-dependent oxidoreductase [Colwellia sp. UCD-KL20]|uniref:SDR family NAD(P)-dependent oxidoreductase n=1 Tax=Colwellia sp. UCD-KL20 TaxID=1917165 RepID=UPI000971327A|nr:SDR family NAD(P)-dependent oxidoreductase [Colwellia sp. UCD-KL20]